jgi:hypothetical protein
MEIPGFVGPSYTLRSHNVACQRSVNIYPEMNEMDPQKWSLRNTPGLTLVATLGSGPLRGLHKASNGKAYAVSGEKLYDITVPSLPSVIGIDLSTSNGRVEFADNAIQMAFVDGSYGYVLDFATGTMTRIGDENFPAASSVAFLDQYIIVNDSDSGRFQFSALNDATDWDGLDVANAEGSPDNLLALAVDHREIILFGELTTEFWFNSGDVTNPFLRINGAFIEHGIAGKHLHSLVDNTRLFWSKDKNGPMIAMRVEGYSAKRISTFAVEEALQGLTDDQIAGGTCWSYQAGGHAFWQTNFPGAQSSWVFDAASGLWHERDYTVPVSALKQRHRADCHIFHAGMHLVGDYANGKLYKLDESVRSDNGDASILRRTWPAPSNHGKRVFVKSLELDMETGVGPVVPRLDENDEPVPPQIMLRYSDDNAHTWSNENWTGFGHLGERTTRVRWQRLGYYRHRVFDISVSDDVPVTLIAAELEADMGAH